MHLFLLFASSAFVCQFVLAVPTSLDTIQTDEIGKEVRQFESYSFLKPGKYTYSLI
jgi:hypothetical protein